MSPYRARTACSYPGCPNLSVRGGRCAEHARHLERGPVPSDAHTRTNRWTVAAKRYRTNHPLCDYCLAGGVVVPAEATDHLVKPEGRRDLMFAASNLSGLCWSCHSTVTGYERANVTDKLTAFRERQRQGKAMQERPWVPMVG